MAYIKVEVDYPIEDGMSLTLKAPCDCTAVTGLKVYYPVMTESESTTTSKVFTFTDSHNEPLTTVENLFKENAYIKVILDVTNGVAFIQNQDTNKYLEDKFSTYLPLSGGTMTGPLKLQGGTQSYISLSNDQPGALTFENQSGEKIVLDNVANPESDYQVANKSYVDMKTRRVTFEYQGNGEYGSSHPNTESFTNGVPSAIYIYGPYTGYFLTILPLIGFGFSLSERDGSISTLWVTYDTYSDNSGIVSWYSTSGCDEQANGQDDYKGVMVY